MNKDLIRRLEALLDNFSDINGGFDTDIRLVIYRLAQVDQVLTLLPEAIKRASDQPDEGAHKETRTRQEALQAVLDYFGGHEQLLLLMAEKKESST